ncbi:AraC-like DNA-binding protein [Rubrivivax gelatinosus]|uniref:helix-turn-helix domain-containing protein n=2 Tax=Rubrivivax gelatinosus TaxID=28068 RepID=UPI0018C9D90E|nr:helix-turn-helix domain-containing protein [Rubrivivax gelatinosus]MBG6081998.1 AraC-like DNA-binding protein [Rubrivivax gelatinosus]
MHAERLSPTCDERPAPAPDGPERHAELELERGTLRLLEIGGSPHRVVRRAGDVSMLVQIEGSAEVGGRRRPSRVGPGEVCLLPPGRDIWIEPQRAFRQLLVDLPLASCAPALRRLDARRSDVRAAATLARYVWGHHADLAGPERLALGDALLRLIERVAAHDTAGATAPVGESAATRQRRLAEAFILERLHDHRLDVAHIAAHLGVSTRYLHRLFADGAQVMQWVQEQRLQACWQALRTRRGRPVAEVAWAWGFTSAAHFSRSFKRRFGVPPSAV